MMSSAWTRVFPPASGGAPSKEPGYEVGKARALWRRANARNVGPYYPYWQYTDLFRFRFVCSIMFVLTHFVPCDIWPLTQCMYVYQSGFKSTVYIRGRAGEGLLGFRFPTFWHAKKKLSCPHYMHACSVFKMLVKYNMFRKTECWV